MEGKQEPTGVSLKAAWILLQALRRYPQLPSLVEMASILEDELKYEWAVRIVRCAEITFDDELDSDDGIREFNQWAGFHLLGPDLTEEIKLRNAIREAEARSKPPWGGPPRAQIEAAHETQTPAKE